MSACTSPSISRSGRSLRTISTAARDLAAIRGAAPTRSSRTRSSRCAATTPNARTASATWIAMSASVSASGSMLMVASAKNFTSFFSSIMYMPAARRTSGRMPRICSAGRIVSGIRRGQPGDQAVGVAAPAPSSCRSACAGSSKRAALAAVTPLRQRSSRYSSRTPRAWASPRGCRISTPSRSRSSSAARWRIFVPDPSRIGCAIPSSSTIWQARSTLMLSPVGKHDALGRVLGALHDPAHDRVLRAADAALQPLAVLVEVERSAAPRPTSSPPRPPPARTTTARACRTAWG